MARNKKVKISKRKSLRFDLITIILIEVLAAFLTVKFHLKLYQSSFLFFLLPSIYLWWAKTRCLKKIIIASFVCTLFVIAHGLFNDINSTWIIPNIQLMFPYKYFGAIPLDYLIWPFSWSLFILIFYEHFVDYSRSPKLPSQFKYLMSISVIILCTMLAIFMVIPSVLKIQYAYLWSILPVLPFFGFVIIRKPKLIGKFLKVSAFFVPLSLVIEITSLLANQWYFPSQYIGQMTLVGVVIPYEELLFWIILSQSIVLSYFEFFFDDCK